MKPRIPEVVHLPCTFHVGKDHVVAVIPLTLPGMGNGTIGIRFESPEQLLEFSTKLMEKAAMVWPDHELIKEFLS